MLNGGESVDEYDSRNYAFLRKLLKKIVHISIQCVADSEFVGESCT